MAKSKTTKEPVEAKEPIQCVACNGTGLSTHENLCQPCEGSGTVNG